MKDTVPVEIEKISNSANDLLNKMNAIIWSMNSSNDTVDNLISYIRAYAIEYMDGASIYCSINTPAAIPHLEISGDKRRNIFLCLKETLNNALKYSKATEMNIDIVVNNKLQIKISDNGIGIDPEKTKQFGNGLKNIARRMKNIGGTCIINNIGGTETRLELPL
jgi:signal transduction histidine kinase